MKKQILFILLFVVNAIFAQSNTELFDKANELYKDGNYQEAINLYKQIEGNDAVSSTLYYNLGNCYYKLNNVANTVYYYEKALLLNPLNKDAANNLEFAKRMTIDRIEELPKTFLQRLETNYIKKLTYNEWAIVSIVFSLLAATLFLLFYVATISSRKRLYFVTSMLSFIILITSLAITYNQHQQYLNTKYAVIFSPKLIVKNAPTSNAEELFELHEGTKIQVLDAVDNWKKIKIADGKLGWIISDDIKMLTDK